MPTVKNEVLQVAQIDDWGLVCKACHHSYQITNLTASERSVLYRLIYAKSDGYGETGHIPCQGYDWSGIRDSSPQAQADMAQAARDYLERQKVVDLHITQQIF
jgi:hypothetical protein